MMRGVSPADDLPLAPEHFTSCTEPLTPAPSTRFSHGVEVDDLVIERSTGKRVLYYRRLYPRDDQLKAVTGAPLQLNAMEEGTSPTTSPMTRSRTCSEDAHVLAHCYDDSDTPLAAVVCGHTTSVPAGAAPVEQPISRLSSMTYHNAIDDDDVVILDPPPTSRKPTCQTAKITSDETSKATSRGSRRGSTRSTRSLSVKKWPAWSIDRGSGQLIERTVKEDYNPDDERDFADFDDFDDKKAAPPLLPGEVRDVTSSAGIVEIPRWRDTMFRGTYGGKRHQTYDVFELKEVWEGDEDWGDGLIENEKNICGDDDMDSGDDQAGLAGQAKSKPRPMNRAEKLYRYQRATVGGSEARGGRPFEYSSRGKRCRARGGGYVGDRSTQRTFVRFWEAKMKREAEMKEQRKTSEVMDIVDEEDLLSDRDSMTSGPTDSQKNRQEDTH